MTGSAPADFRAFVETLRSSTTPPNIQLLNAGSQSEILASLIAPHLNQSVLGDVDGLPLVELPAEHQSRLMAVLLSGDGGWRDLDKTIADRLQSLGVSVVGWDSIRYFWGEISSLKKTAGDLAAIINSYGASSGMRIRSR